MQFTDFTEFQEIVIGKRAYSSIGPFAVQLHISQYFGAISPFAVSTMFSISPFAVDATKYRWNSRVFHTGGSDKNWNGPMAVTGEFVYFSF